MLYNVGQTSVLETLRDKRLVFSVFRDWYDPASFGRLRALRIYWDVAIKFEHRFLLAKLDTRGVEVLDS